MKKLNLTSLAVLVVFVMIFFIACDVTYERGTYTTVSDATDRGYVKAEVTIENDEIADVELFGFDGLGLEKPDDYPWEPYHEMLEELPESYVEENDWDVDIISEATGSSKQANQAVKRALTRAEIAPEDTSEYFDGTFMAISDESGRGSWVIVWVTVEDDEITDVVIHETTTAEEDGETVNVRKDEDYGWDEYHEAREVLPERFVEANSSDVDIVSGATGTSERSIQAVERALEKASR